MSKLAALGQTAWAIILIILMLISGAVGYVVGNSKTVTSTVTATATPVLYTVVQNNVTVHGEAALIPCGALQLPGCTTSPNQTIIANLIRFQGSFYYDSNFTLNNVLYMIWYNNSTYYCVSPTPPTNEQANSCP